MHSPEGRFGLHAIGTAPRQVERDPAALLLECHQRIRDFCALARRLADIPAPEDVTAEAARRVHRYFSEALPLHAADEDDTLEPRLRGRTPELDAALDRMSREHQEHQPLLTRLCAITRVLSAEPARRGRLATELSDVARRLEAQLLEHLEHEERMIIPAIAALLPPRTRESLVAQFAARRHVPTARA
jgi:iron-sulfur cluster repair protein YtfE (RIC family)